MTATPLSAFMDSFGLGIGASSPAGLGVLPLIGAAKGWPISNNSISGAEAGDLAASVFAQVPGARSKSLISVGLNNARHFGTNPVNLASYKSTLMAYALKLAVHDSDFIKAGTAAVTECGTFGDATFNSRWTDTLDNYWEYRAPGNSHYIITTQQDSSAGAECITADGEDHGTFNVAPASPIQTALGQNYMPRCYHLELGGSQTDIHTIRITKASATASGNRIYFIGAWSNGLKAAPCYPRVYIGTPTLCTTDGYLAGGGSPDATHAYGDAAKNVVQTLARDTLNIGLIDFCSVIDPVQHTDGTHPSNAGYGQLGCKALAEMH